MPATAAKPARKLDIVFVRTASEDARFNAYTGFVNIADGSYFVKCESVGEVDRLRFQKVGGGEYTVRMDAGGERCSCPAWKFGKTSCKHVEASRVVLREMANECDRPEAECDPRESVAAMDNFYADGFSWE